MFADTPDGAKASAAMFTLVESAKDNGCYKGELGKKVGTPDTGCERDWTAGLSVFDIAKPTERRQIGFHAVARQLPLADRTKWLTRDTMPIEGSDIHCLWCTSGQWAYVSVLRGGFTDYNFMTIDMSDPTRPKESGRYWLPGMNAAA